MIENEAPVLLILFNRPEMARVVLNAIRQAKPKKLYLSCDGPRADKYETDWPLIAENHKLAEEVDWDCEVHTRFLTENFGCGPGPSSGVTWVLENEDRVIVLEDDCVPSQSFFSFCNELLERYKNDNRFMNIAGTRRSEDYPIDNCDYFYTRYATISGWATWKRAWQRYDYWMTDYPLFKEKKILNIAECDNAALVKRWTFLFDNAYNLGKNQKHAWDYQWQFAHYKHNGYSINTVKNLVTNIGIYGVHGEDEKSDIYNKPSFEIDTSSLRAPLFPYPEYGFDAYHGRKYYLKDRSNLKILYDNVTSKINL